MNDLQIVVLTIKLPDTDLVFVMERAALRNTFDLEKDLLASLSSTMEAFVAPETQLMELGFVLKGLFRCLATGMATVSYLEHLDCDLKLSTSSWNDSR